MADMNFSRSPSARWAHFRHVADIGVRGYGANAAEAFEQAALAMTAVVADPGSVRASRRVSIECAAPDLEILLADWLNALVYEMATRRMLFSRFEVVIDDGEDALRLAARAWGEAVDPPRHQPAAEVKGATLSELKVAEAADGTWHAQCIVDV